MPARTEKKQLAILVALVSAIAVAVLLYYVPGFSLLLLREELDETQAKIWRLRDSIDTTRKDLIREEADKKKLEVDKRELEKTEAQIVGRDPDLWFIGALGKDAEAFNIRLTNWGKGVEETLPRGTRLMMCQLYRPRVTAQGHFNEVGRFIAFVENKYPHLAIKAISIRGRSATDPTCDAELVFGILTKKK